MNSSPKRYSVDCGVMGWLGGNTWQLFVNDAEYIEAFFERFC